MLAGSGGTVLVVDDNAENRALAQQALEDEGFQVELANNGQDALACFARTRADCVLLDIRMPGMDGIAVCSELRRLPGGADVPILFVTAQRDVDAFDRALAAGGDDFITKPYRPSELLARVTAAIKLRRMTVERNDLVELIRQQRDDLMRLQLQKEQLVAFLVHDLKNPVNAIELHTERIKRDPSATDRSRDATAKIQNETQALLRMILNLLDLSKADAGQLHPAQERVQLDELLAEVARGMRVRAEAADVAIDVQTEPLVVNADRELTKRIVENLVDNAIRHAPEQSTIRVIAAGAEASAVHVRIADGGRGIPHEQREQVFDRYVQAGSESARANRGLGLAFCKLAVEAQGGRIWIEDGDPGAVFCIRLARV
jgi:signal transduction histidine kinase